MERGCALFYNCPGLSGFTEKDVLFMTVKELVDNAIDACRHQKISNSLQDRYIKRIAVEILFDPENTLCEESKAQQSNVLVKVQDNGSGVVDGTIEHLGTLFGSSKTSWGNADSAEDSPEEFAAIPHSYHGKRYYADGSLNPEAWLDENEGAHNVLKKPQSADQAPNCALSGKFGLGLKMVLLASSRGGPGTLNFKIRVSDTSTAQFALIIHHPDSHPSVKVSNLCYASSLYKDWPWMTSVSVEIPCTDIVDIRLAGYFDLVSLWNPEICLSLKHDSARFVQSASPSYGMLYSSWFGKSYETLKTTVDHFGNNTSLQYPELSGPMSNNLSHSTTQAYWNFDSPTSLQQRFSEKLVSCYSTLLAQSTFSQNGVSVFLFLCRRSSESKFSQESSSSVHQSSQTLSETAEQVTFWCWRSCNRVPLPPGDSSICLITKSFMKFYKRWGNQFGFLKSSSEGFVPFDFSQFIPHEAFYTMASLMEGFRVSFATWTDLLMLINLDMEDLQYGSLNKSFLRGPDTIEEDIIQLLLKGFRDLQYQCGETSHELISVQKAQYLDAMFNHAPRLASSLACLISHSNNTSFKECLENLLRDMQSKYRGIDIREAEDPSLSELERRLLNLIRYRLSTENPTSQSRNLKRKRNT